MPSLVGRRPPDLDAVRVVDALVTTAFLHGPAPHLVRLTQLADQARCTSGSTGSTPVHTMDGITLYGDNIE